MPVGSELTSNPKSEKLPASTTAAAKMATPEFKLRPLQVTWELTPSVEVKPAPRSNQRSQRRREAYSTAESFHLIEEVAQMHVPLLALTGGEPLRRPDLYPIIEFASNRSVRTSLTLLPTPLLMPDVIAELKSCGLMRAGFWLHASTPELHDSYWSMPGLHRRTLEIIGSCHEVQLPVQINTMISRRNFHNLEPMIELLTRLDVSLWNVFFFVPENREQWKEMISADEHEDAFAKLFAASRRVHFHIKTTEGQHYQRYLLQQRARQSRGRITEVEAITCSPKGVNDGKDSIFVNFQGEVYPSRFLPVSAGNLTRHSLSELYCDSELFCSLRDSSRLKGKCGRCPARNVCGGSRARAYAITGDLFAADPACAYRP